MSEADTYASQAETANKAVDLDQQLHNRRDIEILYKIYMDKRLESQAKFYESRVRENQANADFTFTVGAAVMTISSLVATISAAGNSPVFSLLSAILPAFAALLASFRQLYGWERQISIYRDALLGLERVKLLTPDKDRMPLVDLQTIYPKLVTSGEAVFTGEVNQWGQFVQRSDKGTEDETTDTQATNALMGDLQLSDAQIETIRKIVAAGTGTPKSTFSEHTITVHPEETSALTAGGSVPVPATVQSAPSTPPPSTVETTPITVTTTRRETATIRPQETNSFMPVDDTSPAPSAPDLSAPISVTTTRVDTTVVEHVIPGIEAPAAEAPVEAVGEHEPPPAESFDSLSPGAMHVEAQPDSAETDALISHHELANEPPPPEAESSLTPGFMHVEAPEAAPENPNPEADPNSNG